MIRRIMPLLPACMLALPLLAACATPNVGTDVATAGMPNAEVALRDSMRQVDAEMASLGMMTPAQSYAAPVVPAELNRPVVFSWNGPLEAGVRTVAERVGYRVVVTSEPGARPVTVAVDTGPATALEAFAALGVAAGASATVRVDTQRRQVEVIHHA